MAIKVISSCKIERGIVEVNGEEVFSLLDREEPDFFKSAFKSLHLAYPKFYKMDRLCQLAFLGAEFLLKGNELNFEDDEVALCFFNGQSSLDTDSKHQELINDGANVSPAVFVYTLPNILMGEIAIKNKWYGENLLLLSPQFDFKEWALEADHLISGGKAKYCLGGWVDVYHEKYQLEMFLVKAADVNNILG